MILSRRLNVQRRCHGFTLIETMIVIFVASLLLMAFFSLYEWHGSVYGYQQAVARVSGSARASLQAMDLFTRQAKSVLTSRDFGGTVFNSGTSTLVLQLPAADANGNILPGKWDYAVFYADGNKLMQRVEADASGERVSITKQLSESLDSLTLTYDNADFSQVRKVSVDLKTSQTVKSQLITEQLKQNMYLKNH